MELPHPPVGPRHPTRMLRIVLCVCLLATVSAAGSSSPGTRNSKLFYVSSTTKTVSSTTFCFKTSNAALVACSRKRKRRAMTADTNSEVVQENISHVTGQNHPLERLVVSWFLMIYFQTAHSSQDKVSQGDADAREGKFLMYWMTTTSTTTTYIATSTLWSLLCTPSAFNMVDCNHAFVRGLLTVLLGWISSLVRVNW